MVVLYIILFSPHRQKPVAVKFGMLRVLNNCLLKKNVACEGDMRGERERLSERPMKIVSTRFLGVRKIPIG